MKMEKFFTQPANVPENLLNASEYFNGQRGIVIR